MATNPWGADDSRRCTATSKQTGERCRNAATAGATVCRFHGGRSPQVQAAARRRLALAQAEVDLEAERAKLGRVVPVDPAEAMLAMVNEAAANVAVLRRLVQSLDHNRIGGIPLDGDTVGERSGAAALVVRTGSVAKPAEAAPHAWVVMYDAERERLVRWAKACRDAGVEERRVALAQEEGRKIAAVLQTAIDGFIARARELAGDDTADQLAGEIPGMVRKAIEQATAIDTTATEATP